MELHPGILEAELENGIDEKALGFMTPGGAATLSLAISAKRIADLMEDDRAPVNMRAEDIERDPLMLIARAIEEIAKPTLPLPADLRETAEREAKAIEEIKDILALIADRMPQGFAG